MACVMKCDFCDETIVEVKAIKVFKVNSRGGIINFGKDMCVKCYDRLLGDNLNNKMTNYKKIKNMNKIEMAEFFVSGGGGCISCAYDFQECLGECLEGRKKWLESEARE
ncbi:hypothetical protein [Clostridioides sp. ZZV14-6387]|uniref:hypothetical protein n=1 Tax=Clostridioides sp. ZZV14-6387 TaxID=2811497 RepID=UPI001D1076BC|nr:hypothetical protein [Clostridioides sp. ZZV14-6387]